MGKFDLLLLCVVLKSLLFSFILCVRRLKFFHVFDSSQESIFFLKVREQSFGEEICEDNKLLILFIGKFIRVGIPFSSDNPVEGLYKIFEIEDNFSLFSVFPFGVLMVNRGNVIPTACTD